MKQRAAVLLVALLALAAPHLARAQVTCSIATTGADFGDYDIFRTTPTDLLASVTVGCSLLPNASSSGGPVRFELGASPSAGGQLAPWRQMRSGSATLDYNLYTDFNRTTVWGDGTGGSVRLAGSMPTLNRPTPTRTVTLTIYGRVRQLQAVRVGTYIDTLVVTMLF